MKREEIYSEIKRKSSFLCVGLDSHLEKLPKHMPRTAASLLDFNLGVIEATKDVAVSYKINTAFYEQYGSEGWEIMDATLQAIPDSCFTIADAKRGDIGNTSKMYAKAFFDYMNFDSITVSPYMGSDSIQPFLREDKTVIVLGLTSNAGSSDFQSLNVGGRPLYEHVLETASKWGSEDQLMFVVGATKAEQFSEIRRIVPDHFLLVPGVGAQGGDLKSVAERGYNSSCGLLVNSSRGIIYASDGEDFAEAAGKAAKDLQSQMAALISQLEG